MLGPNLPGVSGCLGQNYLGPKRSRQGQNPTLRTEVTHNRDDPLPPTGTGWSCEPNIQLNICTTSVTEGEVAHVKLV